jgi:hypothetical protein
MLEHLCYKGTTDLIFAKHKAYIIVPALFSPHEKLIKILCKSHSVFNAYITK